MVPTERSMAAITKVNRHRHPQSFNFHSTKNGYITQVHYSTVSEKVSAIFHLFIVEALQAMVTPQTITDRF